MTTGATRRGSRLARVALLTLVVVALAAGGGLFWIYSALRSSLPQLQGERVVAGLERPAHVERDARGVPIIRGETRLDVARATGFVHAQDRFFQMDLLRRRPAGELAELFGEAALEADLEVRPLRLRHVSRQSLERLPTAERAILEAYAEGVNAGLEALGRVPFEYTLIQAEPRPWSVDDTGLCVMAMYLTLQQRQAGRESALGLMHDVLAPELVAFLTPKGTEWDVPLEGEPFPQPPVPGPEVVDLRLEPSRAAAWRDTPAPEDDVVYGSNNWAVAGTQTAHGGALVADDMHLGLGVPNIWYRAALVFPGPAGQRRVSGVTLPGAPFVVAGSNGDVAWGFTNTQGDWSDLVELEMSSDDPDMYLTPDGPRRLEHASETIVIKGGGTREVDVRSTIWGPVLDEDHRGRRRALRWVALVEGGLNTALSNMENARDLDEALALAAQVGVPHQNFVCADSSGRIGWTIAGRIPRRIGWDGRRPGSWADGSRRWDGWLEADEYPRVVDPPSGRIWTANARVASGASLDKIGFGGYAVGARARQIRDDLMEIEEAREEDMLRVQLDDRALFLERWRRLLLDVLEENDDQPTRSEGHRLVDEWGGRASVGSVGYRLVREFRGQVARRALEPLVAPCREADPRFQGLSQANRQYEGPLWALVTERPLHLLDPRFEDWSALLVDAFEAVLNEMAEAEGPLAARTWGEHNTVWIRHPLSYGLPALGRWLDMPREPLPGDANMPRVQLPQNGASERFAVSPGREEDGYLHMPGGQSGHPLSPHYGDGHHAWARGEPTPFLPGPPVHVLILVPTP